MERIDLGSTYCGGVIVEKYVTVYRKVNGEYILIEDVPGRFDSD